MRRRTALALGIGLVALLIGSCRPEPAVTGVNVTPVSTSIDIGETVQLEAVVTPAEARQGVAWSSSDEDVASVSDKGLVLGKAEGTVEITATSTANKSKSASATVEVSYAAVTGIAITPTAPALELGGTVALSATVQPANANPAVTWSSDDEAVALVGAAGLVTAVGTGTAQITATSVQDDTKAASVTVEVSYAAVSDVTITPTAPALLVGESVALLATVQPANADPGVTWSSGDVGVALVSATGLVTAVGTGTAQITATSVQDVSISAVATVTVSQPITNVVVTPAAPAVLVGQTVQLAAVVEPAGVSQVVTWTSDDPAVATVNADGLVVGISLGTARITATSIDPMRSRTVTVTVTEGVASVEVAPVDPRVELGKSLQLTAAVLPAGVNQAVTWTSEDEETATVNALGTVSGLKLGTVTITATSVQDPEVFGSVELTVTPVSVTRVTIEQADPALLVGVNMRLTARVSPSADVSQDVTWSSDDPSVATIDPDTGVLEGVAEGTTTITATSVQDPDFIDEVSVAVVVDPTDWIDCDDAKPLSDDITVDTTLSLACYHVARVVDVSALLTVQPGTAFQFDSGAGLRVTTTGSLRAQGTASFPITFTSRSGVTNAWYGTSILSNRPENVIEHVVIEKAGQRSHAINGNYASAMYVGENAGVAITNSVFREVGNEGVGLAVHGRTSRLHAFTGNVFDGNEGAAMNVTSHQLGAIGTANVFDLEGRALQVAKHIIVRYDEPLRASATWPAADVPYRFLRNHFIDEASAVITIASGARLEFSRDGGLAVQAGALRVEGDSGAPVTFGSASGVTDDWYGLGIFSPSDQNLLRYAVVENAGRRLSAINGYTSTNVYVGPNGRVSITNSTFRAVGNDGYGVYVSQASSRLDAFADNTFDANQGPPMRITSHQLGALGTGNVFGLNAPSLIRYVRVDADGPILATATWPAHDVPYRFFGQHFVGEDDAVITILPGARLTFDRNAGLRVNAGALRALGTSGEDGGITFSRAVADQGWYGVGFATSNDDNALDYVTITGADRGVTAIDGYKYTNLYVSAIGRVAVTNSAFNSARWGIYIDDGGVVTDQLGAPINPATQGSNTFSGNSTGDVRNP